MYVLSSIGLQPCVWSCTLVRNAGSSKSNQYGMKEDAPVTACGCHVQSNVPCTFVNPNRISMKDVPNCARRILRSNPCHSYDPHVRFPPKRERFRDFRYCLSDQKPSDTGISWPIRAFQRYVVCPVQLGIFGRLCASVWKKGYLSRGRIWRLKPRVLEFRNCCVGTRRVESDGSLWEPCVSLA